MICILLVHIKLVLHAGHTSDTTDQQPIVKTKIRQMTTSPFLSVKQHTRKAFLLDFAQWFLSNF